MADQIVDLSVLETMGKIQVLCESEEQAKMFVAAMWEQYPNRMKPAWTIGQTNWRITSRKKYYIPRIIRDDRDPVAFCQSADREQYGYSVVKFMDLIHNMVDLGDIKNDGSDIKDLFGI